MSRRRKMWLVRVVLVSSPVVDLFAASPCLPCHAKEVAGYAKTAMANSLSRSAHQPSGSFIHAFSGTEFSVKSPGDTIQITMKRDGLIGYLPAPTMLSDRAAMHMDICTASATICFKRRFRINEDVGNGTWLPAMNQMPSRIFHGRSPPSVLNAMQAIHAR